MKEKKVLILEPNNFHGEVIPGVVFYFQELGYIVDVYVRKPIINERLFDNVEINGKLIEYELEDIKKILIDKKMEEYDFLFLTSLEIQIGKEIFSFLSYIDEEINTKYGILGIYHTSSFIERFDDYEMEKEGRIFFLSDFQKEKYKNSKILNPHYFGENKKNKNKSEKIKIGILGNVYNASKLASSLHKISKNDRNKLEIYHIGKKEIRKLPVWIKKIEYRILAIFSDEFKGRWLRYSIKETGRLNFPDMYKAINDMDYLLAQIDLSTEEGKHYVEVSTSGSKQISLGLNKPLIINGTVGKAYGFSDENAVFYEGNSIETALKRIIDNQVDINKLEHNLDSLEKKLTKESLDNIKNVIDKVKKE